MLTLLQANNILERHLVIADRVYTMADLKALGNETIVLPTIRDALAVRVKEDDKRKWNTKHHITTICTICIHSTTPLYMYIRIIDTYNTKSDPDHVWSLHISNGVSSSVFC